MGAWSQDRLGLWLVGVPLGLGLLQAALSMFVSRGDLSGTLVGFGLPLLVLLVTYVIAGMDASRRGQTASILVLMAWAIGYPLHMRSRLRYGNYFGLGSGLLAMFGWFALLFIAGTLGGH